LSCSLESSSGGPNHINKLVNKSLLHTPNEYSCNAVTEFKLWKTFNIHNNKIQPFTK